MPMKYVFILIFFCNFIFVSFSQNYKTINTISEKILKIYKKGDQAYKENQLKLAEEYFKKTIQKENQFIDAYIKLASINYELEKYEEAIRYFQSALQLDSFYNNKIYYTLALSFYKIKKYDRAKTSIEFYLLNEKENSDLIIKAKRFLPIYSFADSAIQHQVDFKPILVKNLNSSFSEFLPSFSGDGKTVVFTRRIRDNEDLYISYKADTNWTFPQSIKELNTVFNEGAPAISPDGNTLIFTSCDRRDSYGGCDLYISKKINNKWSTAVNLGDKINSASFESQACLTNNGNELYFTSNRKGSIGGKDIWFSKKLENNSWSTPQNLGGKINTIWDEECPFMHMDGSTLYFSSDGHVGMGSKDIFYSKLISLHQWSKPQNLGYPINTPNDESSFRVDFNGSTAYFVSDNESILNNQVKNLDIYQFELPNELRPNKSIYFEITVKDKLTLQPIDKALIKIVNLQTNQIFFQDHTDINGKLFISIPLGSIFGIHITKAKYVLLSDQFDSQELNLDYYPKKISWFLTKEEEVQSIVLKNILFESNSAKLREESIFELNELYEMIKQKSNFSIEIIGHTDNIGSEEDNLLLSLNRAKVVSDFLVNKGILRERISCIGKGESNPIDDNLNENGRRNNRRTEFRLSKIK